MSEVTTPGGVNIGAGFELDGMGVEELMALAVEILNTYASPLALLAWMVDHPGRWKYTLDEEFTADDVTHAELVEYFNWANEANEARS